jgi:hypothetical protein
MLIHKLASMQRENGLALSASTCARRCPAPRPRARRRRWPSPPAACPIHLLSMLSGTPLEFACTPKPWRSPLGERCGPGGISAAAIAAVTCRHAVIRDQGHKGRSACPLPRRCASLTPCTRSSGRAARAAPARSGSASSSASSVQNLLGRAGEYSIILQPNERHPVSYFQRTSMHFAASLGSMR